MLLSCPACRQATAIGASKPEGLSAEQFVDLIAEAVSLVSEATGQPRLADSHMDSPSYRLARAASVTPKCVRIPIEKAEGVSAGEADQPERRRAEQLDDLREIGQLHTRLKRAEEAIRRQQRALNSLTATIVERWSLPNGRFPSYCCQRCGDQIGWIGRAFQAIGLGIHICRPAREEA